MNVTPEKRRYDPMNAGFIWSSNGSEGQSSNYLKALDILVEFKATEDREYPWRSSLTDGQIPFLLVWPL